MLGEKIRHLRKEKGLSLGELAQRADCAKSMHAQFGQNMSGHDCHALPTFENVSAG